MTQLKPTHTPKRNLKPRSSDIERDPFKIRIAHMVNYILVAHQKEGAIDAKKYEIIYNYLRSITPIWLHQILASQYIDHREIHAILHPVIYLGGAPKNLPQAGIETIKNTKGPANDPYESREVPKKTILADLKELVIHHFGSEVWDVVWQWMPLQDFISRVQIKVHTMDYESVIAEYYADRDLLDRDIAPELPEEKTYNEPLK